MAVTVTVAEVKDGFDTTVSDAEIQMMIDFIDASADVCLDANSVPDNTVKLLKLYAVRHMCTMSVNSGRGTISSERAPSGAGRGFSAWSGENVESTPYGSMLKQMDKYGCVVSVLQSDTNFDFFSIGDH